MTNLVSVSKHTVLRAHEEILGCENCDIEASDIPFTWLLDRARGLDPAITEYFLSEPAICPRCRGPVFEETLVEGD